MEQIRQSPGRLGFRDLDAFGQWYSTRRYRQTGRPASPHTVRTKQVHAARVLNLLSRTEGVFPGSPTGVPLASSAAARLGDRETVERLLDELSAQMTPGGLRQAVYALIDYSAYAQAKGWLTLAAISLKDVPPKNPDPVISVYAEEQMDRFVSAARGVDLRWWALIVFLADTGRRVGEALALQWSWFRLDRRPAYIEVPNTKNGDPQYVPLSRRLAEEVFSPPHVDQLRGEVRVGRRAFRRDPTVYAFPWAYTTVHGRLERFAAKAGLPNRGFHNFRHTVITDRLARGVPLQAVAALAGHRSLATTDRRYNHTNALHYAHYLDPT